MKMFSLKWPVMIIAGFFLLAGFLPGRNPTLDNPPAPTIPPSDNKTEEQVNGVATTSQPALVPPKPTPSALSVQSNQNKVVPKPVASSPQDAPVADAKQSLYNVIKVVDGDTITVNLNGANETLRLIGLDTPETVDPRKPVQCFGLAASNKAKELLTGQQVRLEAEPSQGERDKYQTQFKQAEDEARLNKRGLWADEVCNEQPAPVASQPLLSESLPLGPAGADDCSGNKYNCTDFKTQAEAQAAFDSCGGVKNDIHKLDSNKDGQACESLL